GHRAADALLTASPYQRDTEPVRENVAQLGVRVATTRASWVDVQLFRQDVENALVARRPTFFDPISGAPYFPLVLLNGESFATTGVEVSAQQRLGSRAGAIASVTLSTSDADGDGL